MDYGAWCFTKALSLQILREEYAYYLTIAFFPSLTYLCARFFSVLYIAFILINVLNGILDIGQNGY